MKKILSIIVIGVIGYFGYGYYTNNNVEVTSDPVTVTLKVINSTDKAFVTNCTWCVDVKDQNHTVNPGESYTIQSNTHDGAGTVFTVKPIPSVDNPVPTEGVFQMTYGYWDGSAHVVSDNDNNHGSPTALYHYTGGNWIYTAKFTNDQATSINNTVEFTTEAAGPFVDMGDPDDTIE
mgnify:FL=1|tara:strand:+ start:711 stop:1241 length:531 start_codon:yes stop_codon:yes gene_type:complete